jgi:UDP-glucose:(heptosyl)LPS alpha-1,3-glucosyltransferase
VRVAIVVERFASGAGGVETAAVRLAGELARRGLEVTAVCREASPPPPGVGVVRARAPRFWQPLRVLAFSRAARRATAAGFDVVHSFARTRHQNVYRTGGGSHAAYLERTSRRPALRRLSPRHQVILRIEEAVFRDPSQLIQCNALRNAEEIARRHGVPRERLAVIYNGVDAERFSPARRAQARSSARAELGLEGPTALFVGSGFQRKGLDLAIEGLARAAPKATLLVAGSGEVAAYRALAERRGVAARVRFLGARGDVERLHAAADLFVLPTRYDPFANACLEAMASGLPVATTPDNGVADLIESGRNGLVLEGDFAPAFARLEDREWLERAGLAARRSAEGLTWSRHADEVLALYARVRR